MNWVNDGARERLVLGIFCRRPFEIGRPGPEALEDGRQHLPRSHFVVCLMVSAPLRYFRSLAMAYHVRWWHLQVFGRRLLPLLTDAILAAGNS